jgi:hypothetical protein
VTAGGRQAIVDALSTVPGLSPVPTVPAPIVAGSAWPVWYQGTPRTACAMDDGWYVLVALANGAQLATVDSGDALVQDVLTALWAVGKIDRYEPWQWPVEAGGQTVPCLRFTLSTTGGF